MSLKTSTRQGGENHFFFSNENLNQLKRHRCILFCTLNLFSFRAQDPLVLLVMLNAYLSVLIDTVIYICVFISIYIYHLYIWPFEGEIIVYMAVHRLGVKRPEFCS